MRLVIMLFEVKVLNPNMTMCGLTYCFVCYVLCALHLLLYEVKPE
jgi:hypothetical protein